MSEADSEKAVTPEHHSPDYIRPEDVFGLTDQERLFDRVTHERFLDILGDDASIVHRVEMSSNSYGEFLFVGMSRPAGDRRISVSWFSLGYHEYRERWITGEWRWYQSNLSAEELAHAVPKEEAREQIQQRLAGILPLAERNQQSSRGQLFELIADLSDDDGTIAEFEDLGDVVDWLDDDL